jgi:predicted Rossmann fold flavoprotein
MPQFTCDVLILGAGAAGLMCAATAGERGHSVIILDHANKPAEKIRISGGGRCNFTNIHSSPANFISSNPHFCISALKGYTPHDFIKLVESHNIAYHTKTLGQLFCDHSATDIITMLLAQCSKAGVQLHLQTPIEQVYKTESGFTVTTPNDEYITRKLVIATGGLSIPKMGATGLGYRIAEQFNIPIRAGLVPFTLDGAWLDIANSLSGVAVPDTIATLGKTHFREAMLFTHRGLSGPAILQLSSYWREGQAITLNLLPDTNTLEHFKHAKTTHPKQDIATTLSHLLPKRVAQSLYDIWAASPLPTPLPLGEGSFSVAKTGEGNHTPTHTKLADLSHAKLQQIATLTNALSIIPSSTEGYRTAEVTLGGIDTHHLSSKTMESNTVKGLYFIGEVVDVTGHLGGHNFQWAWSSGVATGRGIDVA